MAELEWDKVGARTYQGGLDHGVLYLTNRAIPWNGLISVEDGTDRETKEYYLEGVKFMEYQVLGDFKGTLKAFTYPDEFEAVVGVREAEPGLLFHDQRPERFGLSYRTKLGNDIQGLDVGYRVHILYNLQATPGTQTYTTLGDKDNAADLSWSLTSIPIYAKGFRPTSHISFKSTDLHDEGLAYLEELLYGTPETDARLPYPDEILTYFRKPTAYVINSNGTWTATSIDDDVTMLDDSVFRIDDTAIQVVDDTTYTIEVPVSPGSTPETTIPVD